MVEIGQVPTAPCKEQAAAHRLPKRVLEGEVVSPPQVYVIGDEDEFRMSTVSACCSEGSARDNQDTNLLNSACTAS